jgi:CheY-like chemotaxis protein
VRRALVLLGDGWWVRAHLPDAGRAWAAVQLSKYRDDTIPVGLDVLGLLRAAGWVAEGRRLPGGHRRFDLTAADRAAMAAADPESPADAPTDRIHVLVADDEPAVRTLIVTLLTQEGFACTAVSDGQQLLRLLATVRPAAVVLDIHMPVLDGFGVMERLRADAALGVIPVVAVSAHAGPEQVRAAGCCALVPKPFDPDDLVTAVRAATMPGPPAGPRDRG